MITKKYFLYLSALLIIGCFSSSKLSNQNLAFIYRKGDVFPINPRILVFNANDTVSRIYFEINPEALEYKKFDEEYIANFRVSYKLLDSYESNTILDSASLFFKDIQVEKLSKQISYNFDIKTPVEKNCLIELELYDLNNKKQSRDFITFDRRNKFNHQNFLVRNPSNQQILFKNYLTAGQLIVIKPAQDTVKHLFVKYYYRDFEIAVPPFFNNINKSFNYLPDSVFTIETNQPIRLDKEGFYHIQTDTSQQYGLTFFIYNDEFPKIGRIEQLIPPLRYLTTKKEFENINQATDKKIMFDKFWLEITGNNKERSKKLIKSYYSRIENANIFFTSYKEGWKTDRGLIYIIYGVPNAIYKNSFSETWIYGEPDNVLSITFNFTKVINPFTGNDYELSRQLIYQNSWYMAVDHWRQGFVFNPE